MSVQIVFETHAISVDNERGIATGWLDGELSGMRSGRLESERLRRIEEPYPGGESYRECVERMREFLDDLAGVRRQADPGLGHSATRWSLDHLLDGKPLEEVVGPFEWQDGWEYVR